MGADACPQAEAGMPPGPRGRRRSKVRITRTSMTTNAAGEGTGAATLVKRLRSGCVPFASRIVARVRAPTHAARAAAVARAAFIRWSDIRALFMEYFDMCWNKEKFLQSTKIITQNIKYYLLSLNNEEQYLFTKPHNLSKLLPRINRSKYL
ncbi:hypothetical protein K1T71_000080 [Dendrolimus kikuchii]|uniref:Uncharacterized protein n=1 Tax=Dendrolimus kikuchii TaxID=765133 RepID=A0ACC1DJ60_9NEOP|nr:hypothetical protein K1T71_000080 [Dendrolimus kikuchii]